MTGVEEIPRGGNPNIYFSSIYAVPGQNIQSGSGGAKRRKQVNYNLATMEANAYGTLRPELAIAERNANKRFAELSRENYNEQARIDIPKSGLILHSKNGDVLGGISKSSTSAVKRIMGSRKTLANYLDETDEKVLRSWELLEAKPDLQQLKKLCSVCGNNSPSVCMKCGARVCSVQCGSTHSETRCGY
ncbi:unnamed protein product [Kuraishia capsulata CBS 1993]|uniref:HIT-type domain-containing protein n=1 Tax=Kuraishia capsulata CBS 1993 TaxID=1382522 RepID=W6MR16_9ASCO|nr:uncharacterized protein KUCA_T00004778001 [Kuraishia capsulata CBS 1993]CDK28793.1 unnamed protein product [Kuraishia capsulata CBS 1993]